jgi:hypothetical protein
MVDGDGWDVVDHNIPVWCLEPLKVRFSDDPWPWLKSVIGDFLQRKPTVQSVLLWQER